jgi:hypothetical protein
MRWRCSGRCRRRSGNTAPSRAATCPTSWGERPSGQQPLAHSVLAAIYKSDVTAETLACSASSRPACYRVHVCNHDRHAHMQRLAPMATLLRPGQGASYLEALQTLLALSAVELVL